MSYIVSKAFEVNLDPSTSWRLQVVCVPGVPDMIVRVDADRAGSSVRHSSVGSTLTVYFFLTPKSSNAFEKTVTSFKGE